MKKNPNVIFKDGKFHVIVNGKTLARISSLKNAERMAVIALNATKQADATANSSPFSINDRFGFISELVRMVATKKASSAIVTGEGGIGKTHTVLSTLKKEGLRDFSLTAEHLSGGTQLADRPGETFLVIKGYSTAKGLFRSLWENRNGLLVFDDCDSVFRDPAATNLLKAALDTYDRRIISWNAETIGETDLPKTFEFKGGVVFVSNIPLDKLDQAVRSRSLCVDLSMTIKQKLERMQTLITLPEFLPDHKMDHKKDAMAVVEQYHAEAKEVNLRTLIQVIIIRAGDEKNWRNLARYMLGQ